jgi:hypothetical protein
MIIGCDLYVPFYSCMCYIPHLHIYVYILTSITSSLIYVVYLQNVTYTDQPNSGNVYSLAMNADTNQYAEITVSDNPMLNGSPPRSNIKDSYDYVSIGDAKSPSQQTTGGDYDTFGNIRDPPSAASQSGGVYNTLGVFPTTSATNGTKEQPIEKSGGDSSTYATPKAVYTKVNTPTDVYAIVNKERTPPGNKMSDATQHHYFVLEPETGNGGNTLKLATDQQDAETGHGYFVLEPYNGETDNEAASTPQPQADEYNSFG